MSGPRNLVLYESGRRVEAAIFALMIRHATANPLAPPLPAKVVRALLPPDLRRSESVIRYHMRAIRRGVARKASRGADLSRCEYAELYR